MECKQSLPHKQKKENNNSDGTDRVEPCPYERNNNRNNHGADRDKPCPYERNNNSNPLAGFYMKNASVSILCKAAKC
jgi:hypothetical protein